MLDLFGRSGGGSPTTSDFISQLLGPTSNVMSGGGGDGGVDQLYTAVNNVAMRIERTASQQLSAAKELASQVAALHTQLKEQTSQGKQEITEGKKDATNLKKAADSIQKLYQEAKKQNTLWVGVSKFGSRGYSQIVSAIREALGRGGGPSGAAHTALGGGGGGRGRRGRGIPIPTGRGGPGGGSGGGIPPIPGMPGGGGAGGGGGGAGGLGGLAGPGGIKAAGAWGAAFSIASAAAMKLASIGDSFMKALDLDMFGTMFKGLIKDENIFKEEMRATMFMTRGYVAANRDMEKQAMKVGDAVMRTGLDRSSYQKLWMKNMQRGYIIQNKGEAEMMKSGKGRQKLQQRHDRDMKSMTMAAGHTAKMLGVSAEQMNDMFANMRFNMGMSASEVSIVSRNMTQIARDTGLAGDALSKALQNAEKLMQKMADSGALTADAAEKVQRLMASAEKFGVGEQANALAEAASGMTGWLNASPEVKRLLMLAAERGGINIEAIQSGAAMADPAMSRKLFEGLNSTFDKIFTDVAGGAGKLKSLGVSDEAIKNKDFTKIIQQLNANGPAGQDMARTIQMAFKNYTGMEVGQAQRSMQALEEANMSYADRMKRLNQELDAANGSIAATREVQARIRAAESTQFLNTAQAMGVLRKEMVKNGKTETEVREAMAQRIKGQFMAKGMNDDQALEAARKYVADMQGGAAKYMENMQGRIDEIKKQGGSADMGQIFKKYGPDLGYNSMTELQKGAAKGDEDAMAALDAMNQEISTRERALSDPMTAMRLELEEINNQIREVTQGVLMKIGKTLLWAIGILSGILLALGSLAGIGMAVKSIWTMFGGSGGIAGIGKSLGLTAGRSMGAVLGKIFAPLQAALGIFNGIAEAEENKRGIGEGGFLGLMTGGSGTGSMFSDMLGIEKGSGGDKALGVAGAGAWGAALGAAIGSIVPGIGTAIGAVIGGLLGMATEILKIITEGTTLLSDLFFGWIDILWDGIKEWAAGWWDILKGIFSGDTDLIMQGVTKVWNAIINTLWRLVGWLVKRMITIFTEIPGLILKAVKWVFLDLPKWIWDQMLAGLQSLADNEWVGPIFEPILEFFQVIYESFMEIYNTLAPAFDAISEALSEVKNAIWSVIGPLFEGGDSFGFLKKMLAPLKPIIKGIATVVGWLIKVALLPLKIIFKAIGYVVKGVMAVVQPVLDLVLGLIQGIRDAFQWLYDVLYGHSIIPDLIDGIVNLFSRLPEFLFNVLLKLPGILWNGFINIGGKILDGLWEGVKGLGTLLLDGLTAVFIDFPVWLFTSITDGLADLGTWLWDNTIGAIIDMIPDWVKDLFTDEGSVLKDEGGGTIGGEAWETVTDIGGGLGRMTAGAGGKLLEGDVLGAAGDVLGGAKDVVVGAVDGIIDTGAAVLDTINPLNWFDEGTREIASAGVAMLHEGEMVVPKSIWSQIAAAGSGSFGGGGSVWDSMSSFLTNPMGMFDSVSTNVGGGIFDTVSNALGGESTLLGGLAKDVGSWFGFGGTEEPVEEVASGGGWWDWLTDPLGMATKAMEPEVVDKPLTIEEMLAVISDGIWELVNVATSMLGAFSGGEVTEAFAEANREVLLEANNELKDGVKDGLKDSVKDGLEEVEKEFNTSELLNFIAKDVGRMRESMTGEYSAMSEALMSAEKEKEKLAETSVKETGAFEASESKSWWRELADSYGLGGVVDSIFGPEEKSSGFGSGFGFMGGSSIGQALGDAYNWVTDTVMGGSANVGAFGPKETKEASELATESATKSIELSDTMQESPLAGKKMPGSKTGGMGDQLEMIIQLLELIDASLLHATVTLDELLYATTGSYSIGGNSTMLGAFSTSESSEANNLGTSSIINGITSAWDWFSENTAIGGIADSVSNAFSGISNPVEAFASNLGLFGKDEEDVGMWDMFGLGGIGGALSSVGDIFGISQPESPQSSLSKALYYDETGEGGIGSILRDPMGYFNWLMGGSDPEVSSNPLDYSDTIKGEVDTRLMSDAQMQDAIAARLMRGNEDAIAAAGRTQGSGKSEVEYFKMMVELLKIIAANTTPEQFSKIVGNTGFGVPPVKQSGIKRTAQDLLSAWWPIQEGENSPSAVNTEGRGMK